MTGEDRGQELTKGCRHAGGLQAGLTFSRGKVRPGEVTTLLVVVLDLEAGEFGEADPQRAAAVVDVLSIQRLKHMRAMSAPRGHTHTQRVCPAAGEGPPVWQPGRRQLLDTAAGPGTGCSW